MSTSSQSVSLIFFSFAGFYKNRLWRNEVAHKKRVRLEEKAATRQEDEEIILTPESRQTLIKATREWKPSKVFKLIVIKGSVTDEELAVINKKRRNTEMTVADMINLTK